MHTDTRIVRFKEEIGLNEEKLQQANPGVLFTDWNMILERFLQEEQPWKIESKNAYFFQYDIMASLWELSSDSAAMTVEFYRAASHKKALDCMLSLASQTTMNTIPYKVSSVSIGDFTLTPKIEHYPKILWVYKNICGSIAKRQGNIDATGFAQKLQKAISQNVMLEATIFPLIIAHPEAITHTLPVGAATTIHFKQVNPDKSYAVKVFDISTTIKTPGLDPTFLPGETVSFSPIDNGSVTITGEKPGKAVIALSTADPSTLLLNYTITEFEVVAR